MFARERIQMLSISLQLIAHGSCFVGREGWFGWKPGDSSHFSEELRPTKDVMVVNIKSNVADPDPEELGLLSTRIRIIKELTKFIINSCLNFLREVLNVC